MHTRLSTYWMVRDQFLRVGVGVRKTDDVRQLLAQVQAPLLAIVRQSRDFDAAYNPLLALAHRLAEADPRAAEQLFAELRWANPYKDDTTSLRTRGGRR